MKKLILAAAVILTTNLVSAQKMATVNSQEILLTMPEVKSMQAKLQSKNDELSKQLESMYKTYEAKVAELKKADAS
nr:OmpH family outer membrane protein [Chitinophagales bacterium]